MKRESLLSNPEAELQGQQGQQEHDAVVSDMLVGTFYCFIAAAEHANESCAEQQNEDIIIIILRIVENPVFTAAI
jgi:hypothetical protein